MPPPLPLRLRVRLLIASRAQCRDHVLQFFTLQFSLAVKYSRFDSLTGRALTFNISSASTTSSTCLNNRSIRISDFPNSGAFLSQSRPKFKLVVQDSSDEDSDVENIHTTVQKDYANTDSESDSDDEYDEVSELRVSLEFRKDLT